MAGGILCFARYLARNKNKLQQATDVPGKKSLDTTNAQHAQYPGGRSMHPIPCLQPSHVHCISEVNEFLHVSVLASPTESALALHKTML